MKVAVDTSPLVSGHSHRGIGMYTKLLIESLKDRDEVEVIESSDPYRTDADIVHYPYFDLFFLTLPYIKPIPTVVTIHDVIPLVLAKHYPPGVRGKIKLWMQTTSLGNVAKIITDSNCSTRDVVKYLKQPKAKVETVYLASNPQFKPAPSSQIDAVREKFGLKKPYFLYVGDINYNKNLSGLLASFADYAASYDLVIVSKALHRRNAAALEIWNIYDKLESKAIVLNDVDFEEQACLYSGAFWYVQPSFYEGFGLPVLEAQACGCPVIATDGGSLPEITGSSVIQCQAKTQSLKEAMAKSISLSEQERQGLVMAGYENVTRFRWEKVANEMIEVYKSALK